MQRIEFSAPLADAKNYPPALMSVHPAFSWRFWQWRSNQLAKSNVLFCRSGRGALYVAAQALKKSKSNLILLPAYHCPALVEPFIAAGYDIKFYPLHKDLSIDRVALRALLSSEVTHALVVRYFGHSGEVDTVLQELQQANIVTFDDCAHDMQSFLDAAKNCADAKICSLPKFIAVNDGGLLFLKSGKYPKLRMQPLLDEIKSLVSRIRLPKLLFLRKLTKPKVDPSANIAVQPTTQTFRYLSEQDKTYACLRLTKFLSQHTNLFLLFKTRQQHCQQLQNFLKENNAGSLLWDFKGQDVPYVVPFLLRSATGFEVLRKNGLQIYRWEELAPSQCENSQSYRGRLIQIPCHQTLSAEDLQTLKHLFSLLSEQI